MRKSMVCLLGLFLAVLCVFGITAQQRQSVDRYAESRKAALQKLDEQLPIVDFNAPKPTDPTARAKRESKDRRYNQGRSRISEGMSGSTRIIDLPSGFPALPVSESTTILIGHVSGAQAHLSDDKSSVYSEVTVTVDQVLKDTSGVISTLVAEREGGRVRLPSGAIYRYNVAERGIPKVGHRYLLFLKQLEDGAFDILTGYELRNGHVIPLDESSPFKTYRDSDEATLLDEVREIIKHT